MEGLIGVTIENQPMGPITCRLEFRDPPGSTIEAIEYAMVNRLPFYFQSGMTGALSPMAMAIVNVDIRSELSEAVTFLGGGPAIPPKSSRYVTVTGYVRP